MKKQPTKQTKKHYFLCWPSGAGKFWANLAGASSQTITYTVCNSNWHGNFSTCNSSDAQDKAVSRQDIKEIEFLSICPSWLLEIWMTVLYRRAFCVANETCLSHFLIDLAWHQNCLTMRRVCNKVSVNNFNRTHRGDRDSPVLHVETASFEHSSCQIFHHKYSLI